MGYAPTPITVTIPQGQTESNAFTLEAGEVPVAIDTPAVVAGSTLTFLAATQPEGTYKQAKDYRGANLELANSANAYLLMPPIAGAGLRNAKLKTSSAAGVGGESYQIMIREVR